ncbi:recombinase family protein [Shinella sp. NM-101]|uniref:recombinase family protein n=1 Tax=Shinella sp. NM-101 TaxID=2744455 RepID=UPI001F3AD59A|nr:recombinase family protein [Shinella sp. NM-101]
MEKIGYARVSTDEQNLDLQIRALEEAGCTQIFRDHGVSGCHAHRPGLDDALGHLGVGSKLVVWRLDRLGRSLINLINLLDELGRRNIRFCSLTENIDTSYAGGKLVFHMMAVLAEFERSLISERTRAGIAAARARGQHIGRPFSLSQDEFNEAKRLISEDGMRVDDVAERYNVHSQTIRRLLRQNAAGINLADRRLIARPLKI